MKRGRGREREGGREGERERERERENRGSIFASRELNFVKNVFSPRVKIPFRATALP